MRGRFCRDAAFVRKQRFGSRERVCIMLAAFKGQAVRALSRKAAMPIWFLT